MSTKTRETILRTLRARGMCSVVELASAAEVSPVSVRHHLTHVLADGLVASQEERHGVGRPRLLYSLTDSGRGLFPGRYLPLASRPVTEMKENLPRDTVAAVFTGLPSSMAEDFAFASETLPIEPRITRLAEMLSA